MFQDDIFPPFPSDEPALSVEEWASGQDKDPKLLAFTADGIEQSTKGPKVEDGWGATHVHVVCMTWLPICFSVYCIESDSSS